MGEFKLEQYDAQQGENDRHDAAGNGKFPKSLGLFGPPTIDGGGERQRTALEVSIC